jgi:hypothetical protein
VVSASARAGRVRFVALGLALGLSILEAVGVIANNAAHGGPLDWRVFVHAGARAGTSGLLHPRAPGDVFAYLPAYAWFLVPFAHLPEAIGFWFDVVVMTGFAAATALLAARIFGFERTLSLAVTFAWTPVLNAIAVGQNATLGLFCSTLVIAGLVRNDVVLTALPAGFLLYKPTYALPLIAAIVVLGRRRALGLVAVCAGVWYVASVAATGGNWAWPADWAATVLHYSSSDFAFNAVKATSIPALLLRADAPLWVAAVVVVVVTLAVLWKLGRSGPLEAGSAACIAGVALSPHAWPYDAALALPMIDFALLRTPAPWPTIVVCAVAICGPLLLLSPLAGFNPQAIVVVGGTLAWLIARRPAVRA